MKIKCAVANTRVHIILEVTENLTFVEFKNRILENEVIRSAIGSLNENKIAVFSTGFPLKRLPEGRDGDTLSKIGVTSGSLITLSVDSLPASLSSLAPVKPTSTDSLPASLSSLAISPQLPATWICNSCTLINPLSATSCTTCGSASPLSTNTSSISTWDCLSCTFLNKGGFICEICGANKPPIKEELVFQRHEIPSDNSCLFHACGLLSGMGDANKMRRIAANLIDKDSSTFSDAILGQPREKYKSWILESSSWGGAIELGVLSAALGIELVAIEVRGGHVYRFGQGAAAGLRGFLVFDGVHYDVIYASNSSRTVTKYLFSIDDDKAQSSALKIVDELRRLRQFVDTSSFTIVCGSCNLPLKGEAEARAHATSTGHVDFREVPR